MGTESVNYDAVLADLTAKRDQLNVAIEAIRSLGAVGGLAGAANVTSSTTAAQKIEPDAFFGLTVVEASRKYLAMMKRPQTTPTITEALQAGGYLFQSGNPSTTVASILNRSDSKSGEVVRVGKGMWGLADWYPNRPKRKRVNGDQLDAAGDEAEPGEPVVTPDATSKKEQEDQADDMV